jgi:hypothetical protein
MTSNIDEYTQIALARVQAHPDHWLLPVHRQALYDVLDPVKSIPIQAQVRCWLDLFTAHYILPLWEPIIHDPKQIWKDYYHVPARMVSMLEELLQGIVGQDSVANDAYHWAEVSGLTGEPVSSEFYHAWCVYDAALSGLLYGIGHDEFGDWRFTEATPQIDNVHSDTANWAAIAFAGGAWQSVSPLSDENELGRVEGTWDKNSDEVRSRRLQFWEWWLLESIPRACEQASQNR